MERAVATLPAGAASCGWSHSGRRLAVGSADGYVSVHDAAVDAVAWKAHDSCISSVVWLPPECGDAVACVCVGGAVSFWEEVGEDNQWKKCTTFEDGNILQVQFGQLSSGIKMVAAYSDGLVKIYDLMDPMDLSKWQIQAKFQNVSDSISRFEKLYCFSASIAWNPKRGNCQPARFVVGFGSDMPHVNSCKIWEFEEAHQRWIQLAELSSPDDQAERIQAVAWSPNIGRPYEIIAIATSKGIAIWHVGLAVESDGRLPTRNVELLPGHDSEVWQLEWDMGGMTLASTGGDGTVRLWQCNLNGVWQEQASLDCCAPSPQQQQQMQQAY